MAQKPYIVRLNKAMKSMLKSSMTFYEILNFINGVVAGLRVVHPEDDKEISEFEEEWRNKNMVEKAYTIDKRK